MSKDLAFVAVPRPKGRVGLPPRKERDPREPRVQGGAGAACNSNCRATSQPMAGAPSRHQPMGTRHSPPPANRRGGRGSME